MLSRKSLFIFALTLASVVGSLTGYGLEWKDRTLTYTTVPFQARQAVVFEFRNTGAKPVTLLDVQTNCDCLEASADQTVYAPGTGGVIKASFRIGERAGLTERIITVVTDDASESTKLTVRIQVPELASIEPHTVNWRISDEPTEKTIEIKPASGLEMQFTTARSTNDAFMVRLETVEAGKQYRLYVKPTATTQPASAAVRIFGKEKSGRDVILSAYANVAGP